MSWASKHLFDPIKSAFAAAAQVGGPASQPAVQTVTDNLTQAQALVENSVTSIVNVGINAILGLIPQGAQFAPLADEIIDGVVKELLAHKSTAQAPQG